jgi:hypothetical protein
MSEFGDRGSGIGLPAEARSAKAGDRIDAAIDLAVREMLDVEPPSGLRGRVLDRIALSSNSLSTNSLSMNPVASAFRRKDNFKRKIVWGAVPLATAAVITLAVLAPWRQPAPPVVTPASPSIARVETKPVVPVAETQPRPGPAPRQRPSPRSVEERIVAAVATADDASVIDPLTPIAPIVVAGTHPADIAPKDIAISPMAPIAPLQIAPLSPPERRN